MSFKKLILIVAISWISFIPCPVNAQTGYGAGKALAAQEIIDVLVSLSDEKTWRVTGNCSRYLIEFKKAYSGTSGSVEARTGFFLFRSPEQTYASVPIRGPVLQYSFFANTCPPGEHQKDDDCFGEAVITVDIVSPRIVKIRQTSPRQDPNHYIPNGERSCLFEKK